MFYKDTILNTHGWKLESAVERHQQSPGMFHIPTDGELRLLEIGDRVKLLFVFATWDQNNAPSSPVNGCG